MGNIKIGMHLKIFFKNKLLLMLYLSMYVSTLLLVFFIVIGASFSYIFNLIVRFIFYESFIFIILSYIFLINDRRNGMSEVIKAMMHEKKVYLNNCMVVLAILLIFYNIFLISILFITLFKNNEISYFNMTYLISYFMNVILPQVISFMIVIMISMIDSFKISSLLLVLSILLMSPYMSILEWFDKPYIPIDTIINIIHLPFTFFIQHGEYSIDSLYGYQNEIYKLWLLLFWFIIFIGIYHQYYFKEKKQRCIIPVLFLCIGCYQIYKPQSIYRYNNKWNGQYADYHYYGMDNNDVAYLDEDVNYTINNYDLNIKITDQLYVNALLHIHCDQPDNNIVLTLYHNYKITSLSSSHLQAYTQDGDFVTIIFNENITDTDINLSYQGYNNNLFSNYQAVALPGYFPWYPMAGEKSVYFYNHQVTQINYGYNPYNRVNATFHITVDAPYNIITNLDEIYSGTSDSLTLIGGNVKTTSSSIFNYYPLALSYDYTIDDYIVQHQGYIDTTIQDFKATFHINLTDFDNKKIIMTSDAIDKCAIFNDYVIISEGYFDICTYIQYKMLNRYDLNPSMVNALCTFTSWSNNSEVTINNFLYEVKSLDNDLYHKLSSYNEQYGCDKLIEEIGKLIVCEASEIGGF
ncbi:MAG: hypothetical protein LUG46_00985 [Erysipelotrichaceae bacterium]|nr:hypothetical protein [Erysipelotrichaceae bacterium]